MPAVSKKQQRFMGMVHAVQKGKMKAPSKRVAEAAKSMKPSDAEEFARTKRRGLPEKKEKKAVFLGALYLQELAQKSRQLPAGWKEASESRLEKISVELVRRGNLVSAVKAACADWSSEEQKSLLTKLAHGFCRWLRRSQAA